MLSDIYVYVDSISYSSKLSFCHSQVDLALDVEKALPRTIRRKFVSTKDEFKLNELSKGIFSWFTKPPVSAAEIKEKTFPVEVKYHWSPVERKYNCSSWIASESPERRNMTVLPRN